MIVEKSTSEFLNDIKTDLLETFLDDVKNGYIGDDFYFIDFLNEFLDSYFIYYDDAFYLKLIKEYEGDYSEANYFMKNDLKINNNLSQMLLVGAYTVTREWLENDDIIAKCQELEGKDEEELKELVKEIKAELKGLKK